MKYNPINQNEADIATAQFNWLIINKKEFELSEIKQTRTLSQSRARWQYLVNIAIILYERGQTFKPPGLKIDVCFTKDNLYTNYWQALRLNMYPNKEKQLNTKEFCDLVEMAGMMFAKVFQISIPFPNLADFLHKKDLENNH